MKTVGLLCFIVLATLASALVSVSPAAAQAGVSDPTGGSHTGAVIFSGSETSSLPRFFLPPSFNDLRLSFRFAFARSISLGGRPARAMDSAIPAGRPARRRWL